MTECQRNLLRTAFVFILAFSKHQTAETPFHFNTWITWNVGQGQWLTYVTADFCTHYDVGGEFGSFKKIRKKLLLLCGRKINRMNISHWDYDHFSSVISLSKAIPRLCWLNQPSYGDSKASALKIKNLSLNFCPAPEYEHWVWRPQSPRNTNDSSIVFQSHKVLIPGDSTIFQEKKWIQEAPSLPSIQVLILGHHGSKTSTGNDLLNALPHLRLTISSARHARFKHPHPDVIKRVHRSHTPVLRTEDWGNIWFQTD